MAPELTNCVAVKAMLKIIPGLPNNITKTCDIAKELGHYSSENEESLGFDKCPGHCIFIKR